jgi:dynein heavy chain
MVTEVQYGGRITDDLDRELFNTYGQLWLNDNIFQPNYPFNTAITDFHYQIPDCSEHSKYLDYIKIIPERDSPVIFGLHPNADLTFRLKESVEMINTLVDT